MECTTNPTIVEEKYFICGRHVSNVADILSLSFILLHLCCFPVFIDAVIRSNHYYYHEYRDFIFLLMAFYAFNMMTAACVFLVRERRKFFYIPFIVTLVCNIAWNTFIVVYLLVNLVSASIGDSVCIKTLNNPSKIGDGCLDIVAHLLFIGYGLFHFLFDVFAIYVLFRAYEFTHRHYSQTEAGVVVEVTKETEKLV